MTRLCGDPPTILDKTGLTVVRRKLGQVDEAKESPTASQAGLSGGLFVGLPSRSCSCRIRDRTVLSR